MYSWGSIHILVVLVDSPPTDSRIWGQWYWAEVRGGPSHSEKTWGWDNPRNRPIAFGCLLASLNMRSLQSKARPTVAGDVGTLTPSTH